MTAGDVVLGRDDSFSVCLKTISGDDQDLLRRWRNRHRHAFFHRQVLTAEDQARWFRGYLERPDDFMFMVRVGPEPVGCMGIRLTTRGWDVYNVIRGVESPATKGCMRQALSMMLKFAVGERMLPVYALVIEGNPAVAWYERNGFRIVRHEVDHHVMKHDPGGGVAIGTSR